MDGDLRRDEFEGRLSIGDDVGIDLGSPLLIPRPSDGRKRVRSEARLLDRDKLVLAGIASCWRKAGLPSYTGDDGEGGHELFLECLPVGELLATAGGIVRLREARKFEKKDRLLFAGAVSGDSVD